jgi:hypothetical protein
MSHTSLKSELDYYIANQNDLTAKYLGKFLVIKDHKVLSAYDSELQAVRETEKTFPLGSFLVQKCSLSKDSYTQTFRSRAVFA